MSQEYPYHDGMRRLQEARETRALADRLAEKTARYAFTDDDRAFMHGCSMFFLATADAHGQPDCSYKGGAPGFVRVVGEASLVFPDYDGNGMYRSLGNTLVNPQVGLLFIDFAQPRRLRVNGTARVVTDDPLMVEFPAAVMLVRIEATRIFPNCPRYIHHLTMDGLSEYTPRDAYVPPVPAWKTREHYRDVLPARDRMESTEPPSP